MSLGMPLDTTLKNDVDYELQRKTTEASGHHTTDENKPTSSVTTPIVKPPPKHAIHCAGEPQDVTEHDTGKPTERRNADTRRHIWHR
jgi:hypothetical protein